MRERGAMCRKIYTAAKDHAVNATSPRHYGITSNVSCLCGEASALASRMRQNGYTETEIEKELKRIRNARIRQLAAERKAAKNAAAT